MTRVQELLFRLSQHEEFEDSKSRLKRIKRAAVERAKRMGRGVHGAARSAGQAAMSIPREIVDQEKASFKRQLLR